MQNAVFFMMIFGQIEYETPINTGLFCPLNFLINQSINKVSLHITLNHSYHWGRSALIALVWITYDNLDYPAAQPWLHGISAGGSALHPLCSETISILLVWVKMLLQPSNWCFLIWLEFKGLKLNLWIDHFDGERFKHFHPIHHQMLIWMLTG